MENTYAKEYYNDFLKKLPTDYKSARWFSSEEAKLDYRQTKRALLNALGDKRFASALEIGPGDGVWTDLLLPRVTKLTLLDQSVEMITRAKERLAQHTEVSYVVEDFLQFRSEAQHDLIFAIRCFEYFEDKEVAAQQLAKLLNVGGKVVLVTKNPEHIKMSKVQKRELHLGQIKRAAMVDLLIRHGFVVEGIYSTTWRFKAKYAPFRTLFDALQWLHVATKGFFKVPFLTTPLTESYLYVATKR